MRDDTRFAERIPRGTCLKPEDFYSYVARDHQSSLASIESHLAGCSNCRRELAQLIDLLYPKSEPAAAEINTLSQAELDHTLSLVRQTCRRDSKRSDSIPRWVLWPVAAAAVVALAVLGAWESKNIYEKNKSEAFYAQARAALEQNYSGKSPSELRLALPFQSTASSRDGFDHASLRRAENLFYQALAVRDDMVESHLGLGYICLQGSQFAQAGAEFQKVLSSHPSNTQALVGRGAANYELALASQDPLQRGDLLVSALNDFEAVLKLNPGSTEARYNKAWALFESGQHKEALQEIDEYLAKDSRSLWAEKLRGLQVRIRATRTGAVNQDVDKAANSRDMAFLQELARQAPYQMPAAIRSAMRRSLELDGAAARPDRPNSDDLIWAAQEMERAYSSATNDHSWEALLTFYGGLSPPQRELKKELDKKFSQLQLQPTANLASIIRTSHDLEIRYASLGDSWQIFNLHQFRGNTLYYKAEFEAAISEYRQMLDIAKRLNSPDLIAKTLGCLALACTERRRFDEGLGYARELKGLAQTYGLESWQAYACQELGNVLLRTGQNEQCLLEYTAALRIAWPLLDEGVLVESLQFVGDALGRLGRMAEAHGIYRRALQQNDYFEQLGSERTGDEIASRRLNLLFKEGDLALRNGDLTTAEAFFKQSLTPASAGKRELEARNRIGLAQVYLRLNQIPEAEKMLAAADPLSATSQYPDIQWQVKLLKGELLKQNGDWLGAVESLRGAIDTLEEMRRNIGAGDHRESFLNTRFDPYKEIVDLLYQPLGDTRKALSYVDRAKSMTLKESLKLQDSGPDRAGLPAAIDRAVVTLEYFFTRDKLLIFTSDRDNLHCVSQAISREELDQQVREFLESIKKNDVAGFAAFSRRLYDELLAPVEKNIPPSDSRPVVILSDGPLHLLPFAALQDGNGRFVVEKTAIAFAPSRSVLRYCLSRGRADLSGSHSILLLDGSANLPSARRELECLLQLYGKSARVAAPPDVALYRQMAAGSEIVHFSGHSLMREGKPVLMLQLIPSETYLDTQLIGMSQIPRSRLVYLAGCSTAVGPISEGETPWGLIPAFLNAGAPAIVASLLPVDDSSTQILTSTFYELLKKGTGKSESLRRAQLALLDAGRSSGRMRPQSWVPYILVGDPR